MQCDVEPDLTDFPHSFQLDVGSRKAALIRLQRQEEAALTAGQYTTPFDVARVHNLLAYILCTLSRGTEALGHVDTVLESQDKNIVSLANKVVILRCLGEFREASKAYRRLKDLQQDKDFEYLKVLANAELAECYSRFGRHVNKKAIELFKEVISKGREPDRLSWRYGLALMYRQAGSLQYALNASNDMSEYPRLSLLQLKRVINGSTDETLKAKAFTEIAWLIFSTVDREMKMKLINEAGIGRLEACTKALQLDDTNTSVLRKVGRIFRYAKGEYLNIACRLLERALRFQESSAIYHDLGLTYKAMALRSKKASLREKAYKERKPVKKKKHLREKKKWKERKVKKFPTHRTNYAADVPEDATEAEVVAKLCKMIKSPPVGAMLELSPGDEYVADAVHSLKKAVEFSEGENSRATYDLALMFEALGNTKKALWLFDSICKRDVLLEQPASAAPLDVIAAFERYGLILLSERRKEQDSTKKKQMNKNALLKLEQSLQIASRVYTKQLSLRKHSHIVLKAFDILLKATKKSKKSTIEKLKEEIKLFKLVDQSKELQKLLKQLEVRAVAEKDVESLMIRINDYSERGECRHAVPLLNVMLCAMTATQRTTYLEQGVAQKVYINAAREQLLKCRSRAEYHLKSLFDNVFSCEEDDCVPTESCSQPGTESHDGRGLNDHRDTESSEDEESENESFADSEDTFDGQYGWDVMVLHDGKAKSKAFTLQQILQTVCGLSVTCMDENVMPGHLKIDGVMRNINHSRVVIVLLSTRGDSLKGKEAFYVNHASTRRNTFVLKVKNECCTPTVLTSRPSRRCPRALWKISTTACQGGNAHGGEDDNSGEGCLPQDADEEECETPTISTDQPLDQASVDAICNLFAFLTHVKPQT